MAKRTIEKIGLISNNKINVITQQISDLLGKNKKILNAVLILTNANLVEGEVKTDCGCGKDKSIDKVLSGNGIHACINITHELNCVLKSKNEILVVKLPDGSTCNRADLDVEFLPQQIMHQNNKYLDLKAKNVGTGKINIATGDLHFETSMLKYKSWHAGLNNIVVDDAVEDVCTFKTHCGLGWKLDASRYLVHRKGTGTQAVYTYIDGDGNYHEFTEKYYYLERGKKNYVTASGVNVDASGKLTCKVMVANNTNSNPGGIRTGRDSAQTPTPGASYTSITKEVYIERRSTSGLLLETDYTKFKNGQYLEMRLQEQMELEEKVRAYTNQLKEYVFIFEKDGYYVPGKKLKEIFDGDVLLEEKFTSFFDSNYVNNTLLLTESEAMQYNTLLLQQTLKFENRDITKNVEYEGITFEDKTIPYVQYALRYWRAKRAKSLADQEDDDLPRRIANTEEAFNGFLSTEQGLIINNQIIKLIEKSETNMEDIKNYFKQYLSCKQQLANLYLQIPVRFVTDDDMVMGFNKYGQFVATVDAYDNQTAIIYEDDKIVAIKDSDENAVAFEYNDDGLLCKIIDSDEKITEFKYESDILTKIIYPNGEVATFTYTNTNDLFSITDHYGRGLQFNYDNYRKVKAVEEFTNISLVSDNKVKPIDEPSCQTKTIAQINYLGATTTTVKNENGVITTYIFDQVGKPTTVFEGERGNIKKAVSLEYSDEKQSYSIMENADEDNILGAPLSDTLNKSQSTRQRKYKVTKPSNDKTDFVFSCWAQADSAYIRDARKADENSDQYLDTNQANRKFELRAEVTFEDDTTRIFRASFDWLNTDWQYLSLPVELYEGDTLPTNLPIVLGGKIKSVDLFIDYSYNTGEIQVDCVSFRSGKWQYSTFDDEGRKLTDEDSESNSVTSYFYDENDRLVKQIQLDGKKNTFETTFEYNKQGKLVRSTNSIGLVEETVYDEKGREIRSIVYNVDDPTSKLYTESKRDDKGNVTADIDESGAYDSKKYIYDDETSVVVKDGKGNKTAYGYKDGNLVSISGNANGEESTNTMHYTAGLLTKVSNGETDYSFTYDGWGRTSCIDIAGNNYASIEYGTKQTKTLLSDRVEKITLKNEKYGYVVQETIKYADGTSDKIEYFRDSLQNIALVEVDSADGNHYNIEYTRKSGKVVSEIRKGSYELTKNYGYENGDLVSTQYLVNDQELNYTFVNDKTPDKRNIEVTLPNDIKQNITYDGLGRTREISLGKNLVKDISYVKRGDHATNRVSTVWYGVNGVRKDSLRYTYDKAGNIETVTENGVVIARYIYDGLNRLIRENNLYFGKRTYEYDSAGNILCKTVNGKRYEYSYPQNGWKDQLSSFNGEECEYDELGNPETYLGMSLKWQGRRLIFCGKNGKEATYTYDHNGIRTSKYYEVNGVEKINSSYIYDGNNLIAEQRNGEWIYYIYGVDGIAGFRYNGIVYLYRKNIQGDITHIYTSDGEQVAHYAYDAWGNTKILQGEEDLNSIAHINPFRYRGYYYDTETELYYLQTRYYDSETGRFISADSIEYANCLSINGLNLYVYCFNNPVRYIDNTGNIPFANSITRFTIEKTFIGFYNKLWGRIYYSTSITQQSEDPGFFYSYSGVNILGSKTGGFGLNAWGWFGLELGYNDDGNITAGFNITPWFHGGIEVGLSGINLTLGVNIGDTSHDLTIGIGIGPLVIIAGIAAVIFSGGQLLDVVANLFRSLFV